MNQSIDQSIVEDLELLAMLDAYNALTPALLERSSRGRRARWIRTLAVEDVLSGLARALHTAGCPVWRLQFNLRRVAEGLGLPDTQFTCRSRSAACSAPATAQRHSRCRRRPAWTWPS